MVSSRPIQSNSTGLDRKDPCAYFFAISVDIDLLEGVDYADREIDRSIVVINS